LNTLELICKKWNVSIIGADKRKPIEIPNTSRETSLPELFKEAGFKNGVEIGVQQGLYSERLCQDIPGLTLYSIDCWRAHQGYREYVSQKKLEAFYEEAVERLKPYDCHLIREWSTEAANGFPKGSIDFCYIDANHDFANVVKDIAAWSPKVRNGGIVAGHDFIRRKSPYTMHHVVHAVMNWTECYNISPWFLLGRRAKIPGELRDNNRSWMWVR
jgi:predicted O-methyltransferase YrrM